MARPPDDPPEDPWRAVTRTVRPLQRRDVGVARPARLHVAAAPPAPRLVLPAHVAPPPSRPRPHAAPADRSPEKRVRRGRVDVAGRLDLHGMTQAEAQAALARFLAHHRAEGARCVLVVTGKGRGDGGGVLKAALPGWLGGLSALSSGYAQAHQKHGGGGAYYVFLRARD
ncbi:MAG: Smr/MutS family protein [Hyphomonadaceae bacterium]|nr:Smr/MutS family protein [Hyphomonadaceae bacterium]